MSHCHECGADCTHKKVCPACLVPVVYRPSLKRERPKLELETQIKARIRVALINAGVMCLVHHVDNRLMHTGLGRGVSDIICIVPPFGRFLAIEVKRSKGGVVSEDQECFLRAVRKFNGVSGVATNVEQALALVAEARQPVTLAPL